MSPVKSPPPGEETRCKSIPAGLRKGCRKGWERLGKLKCFPAAENGSTSHALNSPTRPRSQVCTRWDGWDGLGRRLGRHESSRNSMFIGFGTVGRLPRGGVYIPRLRPVGVRRRRILTKPEQTRPIPTKPQEKSDPSLPSPSSSIIRYPPSVMMTVMANRTFPTLSAPFRTFPNLKIFCVAHWPPTFDKNPNLRESSRIYGNLSEP